jgi:hypothetical protein
MKPGRRVDVVREKYMHNDDYGLTKEEQRWRDCVVSDMKMLRDRGNTLAAAMIVFCVTQIFLIVFIIAKAMK